MTMLHYTCSHGRDGIECDGIIKPNPQPMLGGLPLAWFTDLEELMTTRRITQTLTVRPPNLIERWAYRHTHETVPIAVTPWRIPQLLGAALPQRWRRIHHWLATTHGYCWLPCPTCGHEFGGHETGRVLHWDNGRGKNSCLACSRMDAS